MARKRDIVRPYRPAYCSAETLAYQLDLSRSAIDDYVRRGLLPPPLLVGATQRWRWEDVDEFILASNGPCVTDNQLSPGFPSNQNDPFLQGVAIVAASKPKV